MSNVFLVDICHARENLLHVVFDCSDIDRFLLLLVVLNDIFQVFLAILKNYVLGRFALLRSRVVNFEHAYHIFAVLQLVQDLVLS